MENERLVLTKEEAIEAIKASVVKKYGKFVTDFSKNPKRLKIMLPTIIWGLDVEVEITPS